jgi:hypothetical protein
MQAIARSMEAEDGGINGDSSSVIAIPFETKVRVAVRRAAGQRQRRPGLQDRPA